MVWRRALEVVSSSSAGRLLLNGGGAGVESRGASREAYFHNESRKAYQLNHLHRRDAWPRRTSAAPGGPHRRLAESNLPSDRGPATLPADATRLPGHQFIRPNTTRALSGGLIAD